MKKYKKIIIAALVLVIACVILGVVYQQFMPKGKSGDKTVNVIVTHGDKSKENFTYQTDAAYLGEVLIENELVQGEEGEYGMFITTADKETADESRQQWWCITKSGKQVNTLLR